MCYILTKNRSFEDIWHFLSLTSGEHCLKAVDVWGILSGSDVFCPFYFWLECLGNKDKDNVEYETKWQAIPHLSLLSISTCTVVIPVFAEFQQKANLRNDIKTEKYNDTWELWCEFKHILFFNSFIKTLLLLLKMNVSLQYSRSANIFFAEQTSASFCYFVSLSRFHFLQINYILFGIYQCCQNETKIIILLKHN